MIPDSNGKNINVGKRLSWNVQGRHVEERRCKEQEERI